MDTDPRWVRCDVCGARWLAMPEELDGEILAGHQPVRYETRPCPRKWWWRNPPAICPGTLRDE